MTFREAYHTFCEFQRGKMVYDDELKQAMRIYMNEVDDLIGENAELSVDLSRAKKKLANERRLKRKYFEQLKAINSESADKNDKSRGD